MWFDFFHSDSSKIVGQIDFTIYNWYFQISTDELLHLEPLKLLKRTSLNAFIVTHSISNCNGSALIVSLFNFVPSDVKKSIGLFKFINAGDKANSKS